MILKELISPVNVLSVKELGVDFIKLVEETCGLYPLYEWDHYLWRQNQIDFLKKAFPQEKIKESAYLQYYSEGISSPDLKALFEKANLHMNQDFEKIKKTRKRLMAQYELDYNVGWKVSRIKAVEFKQNLALISEENETDYRKVSRVFKEAPRDYESKQLKNLLIGIASRLKEEHKGIEKIEVIVHYTIVYCYPNQFGTNSPEGIHQDGMDFIVSALVLERKNITGAESLVYGSDMKTKILKTTLQPGQLILQPDRGTELWHEVTAFECANIDEIGFRSTIGLDINII